MERVLMHTLEMECLQLPPPHSHKSHTRSKQNIFSRWLFIVVACLYNMNPAMRSKWTFNLSVTHAFTVHVRTTSTDPNVYRNFSYKTFFFFVFRMTLSLSCFIQSSIRFEWHRKVCIVITHSGLRFNELIITNNVSIVEEQRRQADGIKRYIYMEKKKQKQ